MPGGSAFGCLLGLGGSVGGKKDTVLQRNGGRAIAASNEGRKFVTAPGGWDRSKVVEFSNRCGHRLLAPVHTEDKCE
ncbi:hypothetical protein KDH_79470 [Dictyobacter sp. S3.2.2.5]|uniref:Secreted protein n=1 Tax=Dictyobacter halimunensis TaxID=3026934 RepID=A0ABQ6G5M4_9CHLR|nr:hypothetical protein KDH_79470 [Dictyobacter sp. S3.2.2.5]